jgi:hypothetical protein
MNAIRVRLLVLVCFFTAIYNAKQTPTVAADELSLEADMELRTESSTEETAPEPERPALSVFGFDGFEPGIGTRVAPRHAKENVLQRFGKPNPTDRVLSTIESDRFGLIQTTYWYYDGLEIWITQQPPGSASSWFRKIILTSPAYKLKFGLSIGVKRDQFLATLGPPYRRPSVVKPTAENPLIYYSDYEWSDNDVAIGSHSGVEIFFDQQDRAEKIVWEYYSD